MGKKKYTTEITDAFGGEIEAKEALKVAKKIKSVQKKAYPDVDFKKNLFSRLTNTYLVDEAEDIQPKFSIFQLFGAFASFIFISGALFVVFDMRESGEQTLYRETPVEESVILNQVVVSDGESEVISDVNENIIQAETPQKIEIFQEKTQVKAAEIVEEIQEEYKQENFPQEADVSDNQGENISQPSLRSPESFESFINPAGSSLLQETLGNNSSNHDEASFEEICSEYNGVIGENENECVLDGEKICYQENIYECAIDMQETEGDENIEIDLEELIEQFGQ